MAYSFFIGFLICFSIFATINLVIAYFILQEEFEYSSCAFITIILICASLIFAFICGIKYYSSSPSNFSKLYLESYKEKHGHDMPPRSAKLEKAYKNGWKDGATIFGTGLIIELFTFAGILIKKASSQEKQIEKRIKKLKESREKILQKKARTSFTKEEDIVIKKTTNTINKMITGLEWQLTLLSIKDSVDLIQDIRKGSFWRELQKDIDELEAYIELSNDTRED